MLKISDFSRLGQVSMSMLRYYDEIGLLRPVYVDPVTGYRFYEPDQLSRLHRILALKEMGFGLVQIGQILDEDVSPERLQQMLQQRYTELQRRIQEEQRQLAHIEARLKSLEQGESMLAYEVVLKSTKSLTVISTPGITGTIIQKVQCANDLLTLLKRHGVKPVDHILCLYYEHEYRDINTDAESNVEIAVPVERSAMDKLIKHSNERVAVRELPAVTCMASVIYHGNPYMIGGVFQALGSWIETNAYTITGTCRKVWLRQGEDLDDYLTEIQFPVEKTR